MHLLLIEDDMELGAELQRALGSFGFTSVWLRRARDVLMQTAVNAESPFACALLDLGLPDGEGLDILRRWRKRQFALPVIILTARDALASRLEGLDAGADDYVIKPVAAEELASRIRAVTRRAAGQSAVVWDIGRLSINSRQHQVRLDGEPVALSPKEYKVVTELARNADTVVSKHRLAQALTPFGEPVEINALEVHVHNLRRKLGAEIIVTVRGVGYQLCT